MKRKMILGLIALGVFAFLVLNVRMGYAEPNAAPRSVGFEILWYSIDGGGGTSTGGTYSLSGTIGQFDAGSHSGGTDALNGGFWVDFLGNKINLPLILR